MSTSAPVLLPWPAWKRAAGALRCFVSTGKLAVTIQDALQIAEALEKEAEILRVERVTLAKLAHPEPQFFNPLAAWDAQELRDRVLREESGLAQELARDELEAAVVRGVEAAWLAMWLPEKPSAPAPTEQENPLFWCQIRAAVIASGVLHGD